MNIQFLHPQKCPMQAILFSSSIEASGQSENNSDVPIKEESLNGITEDKSVEIVEDLESNSDVVIKEDSLNGTTENLSLIHI